MAAIYDNDATNCISSFDILNPCIEGVYLINIFADNCQPPINDFDDRQKKGKKGKYLKDWE